MNYDCESDKRRSRVTLSGGEPTMQARFAGAFLKGLRARGIHTALDTCGLCSKEVLDMLLPYSTMVLYDIKEIDPHRHKVFTGSTNEPILENLMSPITSGHMWFPENSGYGRPLSPVPRLRKRTSGESRIS